MNRFISFFKKSRITSRRHKGREQSFVRPSRHILKTAVSKTIKENAELLQALKDR